MYWRIAALGEYRRQKGTANLEAMRAIVQEGHVAGLLAYDGPDPIGWCALAPREEYPALTRSPSRRPVGEESLVWSVPCLYVARTHRGREVSKRLLGAAIEYARAQGARILEGYPVPPKPGVRSTSYAWTGFVSVFRDAGFVEHERRSPTRPIMRFYL